MAGHELEVEVEKRHAKVAEDMHAAKGF